MLQDSVKEVEEAEETIRQHEDKEDHIKEEEVEMHLEVDIKTKEQDILAFTAEYVIRGNIICY